MSIHVGALSARSFLLFSQSSWLLIENHGLLAFRRAAIFMGLLGWAHIVGLSLFDLRCALMDVCFSVCSHGCLLDVLPLCTSVAMSCKVPVHPHAHS